jgi:hypothetical protein
MVMKITAGSSIAASAKLSNDVCFYSWHIRIHKFMQQLTQICYYQSHSEQMFSPPKKSRKDQQCGINQYGMFKQRVICNFLVQK